MAGTLHLVKLCVGAESIEDLCLWQEGQRPFWPAGCALHVTRMRPKQEEALLNGGSLYWVVKGIILCRQKIIGLEEATREDGVQCCTIVLDQAVVRTHPAPRRAFQGWRYLEAKAAPPDLMEKGGGRSRNKEDRLPPDLMLELAKMGLR